MDEVAPLVSCSEDDAGCSEEEAPCIADDPTETEPRAGRAWCAQCLRPRRICLCNALPSGGPLETRTRVMLLVHPKETKRPLGTAPLLRLCLKDLVVKVGDRFPEPEEDPELHAAIHAGGNRCMLVCPGDNAEEMRPPAEGQEAAAEEALFRQPPATLIFIDGRWSQAKTMVNRSVWLQQLPRVVLCPTSHSGYVFRKQPKEGCLSTLEAVSEALLSLEGRRGPVLKQALLAPFQQMVQLQCPFIPGPFKDKNAKQLNDDEAGLRLFDIQALLDEQSQDQTLIEVNCVCRWGEHSVEGRREIIVVEVVRSTDRLTANTDCKRRAAELSVGRPRGRRCWILPLTKIPPGSQIETHPNRGVDDGCNRQLDKHEVNAEA